MSSTVIPRALTSISLFTIVTGISFPVMTLMSLMSISFWLRIGLLLRTL